MNPANTDSPKLQPGVSVFFELSFGCTCRQGQANASVLLQNNLNMWNSNLMKDPIGGLKNYDLVLYFASLKTASNQTTVRINWAQPMGADVPKFVHEIPTLFVSVDNPYHLQDVPMVKTFINGYSSNEYVVEAIVDKLPGKSPFKGINPVDPFCGLWDARL